MKTFNFHLVIKTIFIPLLFWGFIGCQVGNLSTTNANNHLFVHEKHGYSLTYPQGWDSHRYLNGDHGDENISAVFNKHLQLAPAVTIAVKAQEFATLENAIDWGESRIYERYQGTSEDYRLDLDDVIFIERNQKILGERNHTSTNNQIVARYRDIYLVAEGKLFIFTYSAKSDDFDEDISVLYEIVDSFTITNNN